MKKQQIYEPSMPCGTLDVIEAFGLDEDWVFSMQIEMAVEWLSSYINSAMVREVLYKDAYFWQWFLCDWGAVDDVIMLSMTEVDAGFRISNGRGGHVILPTEEACKSYYRRTHKKFYSGKEFEEMPTSIRVQLYANIQVV